MNLNKNKSITNFRDFENKDHYLVFKHKSKWLSSLYIYFSYNENKNNE